MASSREILKRRRSVANIHKITKTMEMISTARFQRAHRQASAAAAHAKNVAALLRQVAAAQKEAQERSRAQAAAAHPLLRSNEKADHCVVLVLTSNRGLCGGYNSNVLRVAFAQIDALHRAGMQVEVQVSGKKGAQAFRFLKVPVARTFTEFDDKTAYAAAAALADEYCGRYAAGQLSGVGVVTTHFVSAARHEPTVVALLPVEPGQTAGQTAAEPAGTEPTAAEPAGQAAKSRRGTRGMCLFSPEPTRMLESLVPAWVRSRLFQCFVEAAASEQVSRMRAMKSATENAEQMLRALTRRYNRVRQSNITSELLDIMGGAEALK